MNKQTVLSGIRPTGYLHLGNYFGAVQNFLRMQDDYNCFFFIADIHSLTTHPTPENLQSGVRQVLAEYLACGIDPEKATIFIQSDVPEVSELYAFLNMNAYLGELERTTSFKDKARQQPDNVNAGLLTYPVLMAADIIIHKANFVPVGKDQEQNLEMARKFAKRFNRMYNKEVFPIPQPYTFGGGDMIKVPGLDGSGKMGKSEGNAINLFEDPKSIRKKVMRAVTDSGPTEMNQQKPEAIQNLFTLMKIVSTADTVTHFDGLYNNCEIRYGDLKKHLAEDIIAYTSPIRERIIEILEDDAYLAKVAKMGAEKARESASRTLNEVKDVIGFRKLF
ncbi:MAG: tryptophan--tRNA ligase [Prolixibacteraceae bacterium]|jgi:tryptophanyl-tRNA synthetase|nr:tryptophan--tRNA ligase [Prolixibacteraceae bacterium]MBT6007569.1 tryptophan--tRNA ligase [Prolixibacteraceae bacterium]MBT6763237.1 tryptophan--tRNA ligase [Prolixibacteraceae bacterium]MBT6998563.1 tryptophan--tRNA ligase [Prolixibacteraceae bacterium]MBT7395723.1 tryptophan--tRNA ligase [Prolixibacteraceae bacterium]